MKRLLAAAVAVALIVAAVALSRNADPGTKEPAAPAAIHIQVEKNNPWNHLKLNNDAGTFRFAIVSDRTGGARPSVFERAVEQLNWMQPEFVVSVGDLIEGDKNLDKIDQQWKQFNSFIAKLEMPFFYTPGNHDYANKLLAKRWHEQFGRAYYHFTYKDVLFLILNTEEVPSKGPGKFGPAQIAFVKKTLQETRSARWTMVFLHKPVWTYKDKEVNDSGWLEIEGALAGRKYTVFAGHKHKYEAFERRGQRYYMLATTGGSSKMRGPGLGEFDHIVWVTMKKDGPVLANLMMEGIFPRDVNVGKAGGAKDADE
jgi:3',5'-cyclic AMP phosphodiesterase CpdA